MLLGVMPRVKHEYLDALGSGRETRAFVVRIPGSYKLKSIPIPEDIKALCL